MSLSELKKQLKPLCSKYDISYMAIFGSYAKGKQNKKSDLDLLIKFKSKKSFFDLIETERELSKKIGIKVDLVTFGALSPFLKKEVKQTLKTVYEG